MDRTTSLAAALLLCIVVLSAVLVASPLSEIAASSESHAFSEVLSPPATDTPVISDLDVTLASTSSFTVSLPIVMSDYRYRPLCSPESPFSIEIAAIHQVVPDEAWPGPDRGLAEAEWLERLEEGYPTLVQALADSGACWTRVELNWAAIQPDPPPAPYNFSFFDRRLQVLSEAGIQILALVHRIPSWAGHDSRGPIYPDRMDDFAQFLADLVERYKQPPYNIHHWEIINEPDAVVLEPPAGWGFLGSQYTDMLEQAYPAIKAADPSATVLMGGLAYDAFTEYDGWFYRYFPDDVMASGGGASLDATAFHFFPDFAPEWERWNSGAPPTCGVIDDGMGPSYEAGGIDIVAKASHFRNRLRVCSGFDKPIWVTELGVHGHEGDLDSLAQQARYVFQGNARALAAGIENIAWFALVSPPYDPWEQGLLYEDDWSPKPAFHAYQTLTYELAGYQYSRTLDVPKVEGYVFRNGSGQEKVMAWSWGEPFESGSLSFSPASGLRVVDREGQVTLIRDGGLGDTDKIAGSVTIQLPAVPVAPDPPKHARYTAEPLIISK